MRLDRSPPCAPDVWRIRCSLPPRFGFCRCFLCGHESGLPLPLDIDQTNWIECEECGLDNEIPPGGFDGPVVVGRVPTRIF